MGDEMICCHVPAVVAAGIVSVAAVAAAAAGCKC